MPNIESPYLWDSIWTNYFILTACSSAFFCSGDIFSLMFFKASFPSSPWAFIFLRRPLLTPLTTEPKDNSLSLLTFYKTKLSCENKKKKASNAEMQSEEDQTLVSSSSLLAKVLAWAGFHLACPKLARVLLRSSEVKLDNLDSVRTDAPEARDCNISREIDVLSFSMIFCTNSLFIWDRSHEGIIIQLLY